MSVLSLRVSDGAIALVQHKGATFVEIDDLGVVDWRAGA